MRTIADEIAGAKYAHVERERRFLVDRSNLPPLDAAGFTQVQDRYICDTRLRLRRMTAQPGGAQSLKLTKKYEAADPLARRMVTAYLDDVEFALIEKLPAFALSKRRYTVRQGEHSWSIDVFEGALAGLVSAEVEAESSAELRNVTLPCWVGEEVSCDPRYQGSMLAAAGLPTEK